ncbi:B-cell receptor CD22-like [Acanthopagrus latus]|uniref:B-cell receptor CD22-like n=1 Tax=Acanthopagrus latus TaxID=8177 RepID=UPI00187C4E32|nr:B-cell receptor CD22-like [Acanthopagrus latus]
MSLSAAVSGFVVFLLSVSVIQGQDDWGVTYSSTEICAFKGSTVDMSCTYRYPSTVQRVENRFWYTKVSNGVYMDLKTDPEYSGRVQYIFGNNDCTLRITDLRESDSAEYKFRFITDQEGGRYTGKPGVTLRVTGKSFKFRVAICVCVCVLTFSLNEDLCFLFTYSDLQVKVNKLQVYPSKLWAELMCHSRCRLPGHPHFVWYKNGRIIQGQTSSYLVYFTPADSFSCAVAGHENCRSPSLYVQRFDPLSESSAEIVEGSSVNLTCSSDANPAAKYIWYKENGDPDLQPLSKDPQLVFSAIQSSDSGEYYCTAENELGRRTSEYIYINVKYGPRLPSVSVSPSAEIVEGSSVTLTCSSDANPAANYTWYKKNGDPDLQPLSKDPQLVFSSIQSSDSGEYYCTAENQLGRRTSEYIYVDVTYGPRLPSVSVSPSAEIVEGSSVTLTCSSDANPAANYTWYKENEDSPKASGQIFTITDFRAEHSGNYFCEVQNRRGGNKITVHLTVAVNSTKIMNIIRLTLVVLMLIPLLLLSLWTRKKKTLSSTTEPQEPVEMMELVSRPEYENVSDFTAAQTEDTEQQEDMLSVISVFCSLTTEERLLSRRRPSSLEIRGADMSLSAAVSGFVVFLLSVSVIQGQDGWGVTYSSTEICAFKGSTVDMSCTYRYPSTVQRVVNRFWFTKASNSVYTDLKTDPQYSGRVQYICGNNNCSLTITDLRESDSAEYKFRFITGQEGVRYYGSPGVTLTVTDLQVRVNSLHVYVSLPLAVLMCHSNHRLPGRPRYVWYKNGRIIQGQTSYFYLVYFTPADSFSCAVAGHENCRSPPVYGPKLPSVSVSPSAEIVEGSSVTLTCSSDANPAAEYTWYKNNGNSDRHPLSNAIQLHFSSIQSSDSGEYYCTDENQLWGRTSDYISIDVKYGPRLPSVSVSPSAEIVEGSSVTLTCSSDANPAANFTWYKENEDSPKASGQIFTITDFRTEHSGNYSCEAQSRRGRNTTTVHLTVVAVSGKSMAAGTITVVLLAIISLSVFLWIRKKRASRESTEAEERPDDREQGESEEQDDFHYASVHFSNNQADNLSSNIRPAQPRRHVEQQEVEYAAVRFNSASTAPRARGQGAAEDPAALYSTVNKTR